MDLRSIANGIIQVVNNDVQASLLQSTGYVTADNGQRLPQYFSVPVIVQVQSLTFGDIQQLDGLNIQGVRRKIYITPNVFAIIRVAQKGGDLIVFQPGTLPEGDTWLCAHVLEAWSNWRAIAITLQNDVYSQPGPALGAGPT